MTTCFNQKLRLDCFVLIIVSIKNFSDKARKKFRILGDAKKNGFWYEYLKNIGNNESIACLSLSESAFIFWFNHQRSMETPKKESTEWSVGADNQQQVLLCTVCSKASFHEGFLIFQPLQLSGVSPSVKIQTKKNIELSGSQYIYIGIPQEYHQRNTIIGTPIGNPTHRNTIKGIPS